MISIVIRARNCAPDLSACLDALARQEPVAGHPLEIIVVDNESQDDTARVAAAHGARIVPFARDSFSWGGALNAGIRAANGPYVVLLSADAHPADPAFIREMIAPFRQPQTAQIAAVYGRQLPRDNATLEEIARLGKYFGDQPRTFDATTPVDASGRGTIASNACAAIRRDVWERFPYDETLAGGEEGPWTRAVLDAGFSTRYEPRARVFHSHDDPLFRGAVRGVELFIKSRRLKNLSPSPPALARWLLANIRTRLRLCLAPRDRIRWVRRLEGIGLIPLEALAWLTAYTALSLAPRSNLRAKLWDLRLRRN